MSRTSGAYRLGPVARKLLNPDAWTGGYPGPETYSRELDALLHYANQRGYLGRFSPNLESIDRQRDKALNELRIAYLFEHLGFSIQQWDPPGANRKIGEFIMVSPEGQPVFVELKSRGWESELTDAQKQAGLARSTKWNVWRGGAIGNWRAVHECIKAPNCYPKFLPTCPNLLVIADDLRVPLAATDFHVEAALYGEAQFYEEDGYFTTSRFENLGGLATFNSSTDGRAMEYEISVYENPMALSATKVAQSILALRGENKVCVRGTDPRQGIIYL
jgi:hypothetical protein